MTQASSGSLLLVGKVIGPHGLQGLLRIWAYAGAAASFLDSETVLMRSVSGEIQEYTVTDVRPHKNAFLMKLEGLGSRDEVEKYKSAGILKAKKPLPVEKMNSIHLFMLVNQSMFRININCRCNWLERLIKPRRLNWLKVMMFRF